MSINDADSDFSEAVMLRDLRRAKRRPLWVALGIIGVGAFVSGLYVLGGKSAAASELAANGYTESTIRIKGPFSFAFSGKKGTAQCQGTYERVPFSSNMLESCYDVRTTAGDPPKHTKRQMLENSLSKKYASEGFATYECPEVSASDLTVTCTIAADNGTRVPVTFKPTGTEPNVWAAWSFGIDEIYFDGPTVAAKAGEVVSNELKKKGSRQGPVALDCGSGVQATRKNEATCKATSTNAAGKRGPERVGSLTLKLNDDGSLAKWTLTGL